MARVFISYKRNLQPDESVSAQIFDALKADAHDVFIDRKMTVGTHWAAEIQTNIRDSDFLIILLTQESCQSELVRGEVEIAREAAATRGERPLILPVRVGFSGRLPYPLSSYLDPLQYVNWEGEADTKRVLEALRGVVSGVDATLTSTACSAFESSVATSRPEHSASLPSKLPPPGGTLDIEDHWYISRDADSQALDVIRQEGGRTISIKGPRQMGKSSLLVRVLDTALNEGRHGVLLDFQLFGKTGDSADVFFRRFVGEISEQLDLPRPDDLSWDARSSPAHNCTRFVETHVLEQINAPLTLAIDEGDLIFTSSFRNDFFGMLRSWHNNRANPIRRKIWRRLDLVLVTSTEPYLFIDRADQSPFNVGAVLRMEDFTRDQVAECSRRHSSPLSDGEITRLYELVGGHPYLTRKALYAVTRTYRPFSAAQLFDSAAADAGPFGDHLRNHLLGVCRQEELADVYFDVVHGRGTEDVTTYNRLLGAGLVKRENGKVVARCRLYQDYFFGRLHRHG